jgi:chromosome partitioning protein
MKLTSQNIIMFSTLLDRNSLSQQINGTYLTSYAENIISTAIRRSVKYEEALLSKQSILEYAPSSVPSEEYYQFVLEEWYKINDNNPDSVAELSFLEESLEV